MKARSPGEFKAAWQWHIDQLASLALAANISYDHYTDVKQELESWLTEAISINIEKDDCCE